MESVQANQTKQSEEMTEFEATQERILSATVERILKAAGFLKDPYQRQALERALASIESESPDSEQIGKAKQNPADWTEALVKQWLLERDYSTKLAAILLAEYMIADHGTEELARGVMSGYEDDILAVAENPDNQPNGISVKEIFLSGVVAESLLTNQRR